MCILCTNGQDRMYLIHHKRTHWSLNKKAIYPYFCWPPQPWRLVLSLQLTQNSLNTEQLTQHSPHLTAHTAQPPLHHNCIPGCKQVCVPVAPGLLMHGPLEFRQLLHPELLLLFSHSILHVAVTCLDEFYFQFGDGWFYHCFITLSLHIAQCGRHAICHKLQNDFHQLGRVGQ